MTDEDKGNRGHVNTCSRLQAIFELLLQRPHTTKEIGEKTGFEAIGSTCSELRRSLKHDDLLSRYKGYSLPRAKYMGRSDDGFKIYLYRLERIQLGQQSFLEDGFSGQSAVMKG